MTASASASAAASLEVKSGAASLKAAIWALPLLALVLE
jgi:hypothetical protein